MSCRHEEGYLSSIWEDYFYLDMSDQDINAAFPQKIYTNTSVLFVMSPSKNISYAQIVGMFFIVIVWIADGK